MQITPKNAISGYVDRKSRVLAMLATMVVIASLLAAFFSAAPAVRLALFFLAAVCLVAVLIRVVGLTRRSQYTLELGIARVHILLHFIPLLFFVSLYLDINAFWLQPGLVVLFVLFFYSGRKTWQVLAKLFPSTPLYRIFFRANSVFLCTFPLLYLGSLLLPDLVSSGATTRMAIFYFSIHLAVLGVSCLKIESDLLLD
jgi:hypothetical protein